jgi:HD superfamily phosphohydrolase
VSTQAKLTVHPLDQVKNLEACLRGLGLAELLDRQYLRRLKDIRLLGTMPYIRRVSPSYSRYEHSLAVAYLSVVASRVLHLSDHARTLLAATGLLHDVGHPALSHAAEVFLRRREGRFHHGHTSRIISRLARDLRSEGKDALAQVVQEAALLLSGHPSSIADGECLRLLVDGPLSMDMIEGVTRTARSIGMEYPDPMQLVNSLRRDESGLSIVASDLPGVEDLYTLERKIYEEVIYSPPGLAAEAMLTRSLEAAFPLPYDDSTRGGASRSPDMTGEFLTLTDSQLLSRVIQNKTAKLILDHLNKGRVFRALSEIAPSLHSEMEGQFETNAGLKQDPRCLAHFEKSIARELGVDPVLVILHATIRKVFRFDPRYTASLLDDDRIPMTVIKQTYRTKRTYNRSLDLFLPPGATGRIGSVSIPTVREFPSRRLQPDALSMRFTSDIEKDLGAAETPEPVARFMASWAIRGTDDVVLDPALGDGGFLMAAYDRLMDLGAAPSHARHQLVGVEVDPVAWNRFGERWRPRPPLSDSRAIRRNFLELRPPLCEGSAPNVVIANPPYVRGHRLKGTIWRRAFETANEVLQDALGTGHKLSERASSWAPYLLNAIRFLTSDGRLAMVLPTELLSADYAADVRRFLLRRFPRLCFVLFARRVFPQEQDVLLLLAESQGPAGVKRIEVSGPDGLEGAAARAEDAPPIGRGWLRDRWTALLTRGEALDVMSSLLDDGNAIPFSDVATVNVGIVTGDTDFYVLSPLEAEKHGIRPEWLKPVLTKASQIPGAVFSNIDLCSLQDPTSKHLLLRLPPDANVFEESAVAAYLEEGKRRGVHLRYKCRKRWPWYSVPYSRPPDAFVTYMSGSRCRICLNRAAISCTNTIHQVFMKQGGAELCAVAFYSSLSALSHELIGRTYGGGLLKLEPGDLKRSLLPNVVRLPERMRMLAGDLVVRVDRHLRFGQDEGVWEEVDRAMLLEGLGIPRQSCEILGEEYRRLRARRYSRSNGKVTE